MSGIGCGIGVGLGGSRRVTPSQLHAQLAAIFGASLVGLWIGEDLVVDGSNNVTSWPGRAGATLARTGTGYGTLTTVNNRRAVTFASATTAAQYDAVLGSVPKSVLGVLSRPSGIPTAAGQYRHALTYGGVAGGEFIQYPPASLNLRTDSGWTHYVDGLASEQIPETGLHSVEGINASAATFSGMRVAFNGNYSWPAPIALSRALSVVPTAPQRAAEVAVLGTYYSIT